MQDLYQKLGLIITELLFHSNKIKWISAPTLNDNDVIISVRDKNDNKLDIIIDYITLNKLYDHKLETYIFKLMQDNSLL